MNLIDSSQSFWWLTWSEAILVCLVMLKVWTGTGPGAVVRFELGSEEVYIGLPPTKNVIHSITRISGGDSAT